MQTGLLLRYVLTKRNVRCCIDKTSSAELSEAINSMFRWYQNAAVCYAFLSDVPCDVDTSAEGSLFARSRWFTRGWTLQELIAPAALTFFSKDWHSLGTKSQLYSALSSITGIEKPFLTSDNLELASTAKKMSWAASRKTSRVEDIAYSLLGIFDINMPLIYGEGKKAFKRLQEELLKTRPDDHTIFAWGTIVSTPSIRIADLNQYLDRDPVQRSGDSTTRQPLLSLLAESPRAFASTGGFIPMPWVSTFYRSRFDPASFPIAIDRGIRLELPVLDAFDSIYHWDKPKIEQIRTAKSIALLCCPESDRGSFVRLPVQRWGNNYFGRSSEILLDDVSNYPGGSLLNMTKTMTVAAEQRVKLETGDTILRRHVFPDAHPCEGSINAGFAEVPNDNAVIEARKLRSKFGYFYSMGDLGPRHAFGIQFSRAVDAGEPGDSLCVEVFPVDMIDDIPEWKTAGNEGDLDDFGLTWWPARHKDVVPTHSHVMQTPVDTWSLDEKPFPRSSIRAERMVLDEDGSFVDVVDIVIWPTGESNQWVRTLAPSAR